MTDHLHLDLFVVGAAPGRTQPVPVERLDDVSCRVLHSPGLVEGIAAGDVIRLKDGDTGEFVVVERGGNVSIKVAGDSDVSAIHAQLVRELGELGGWCDGSIARAAVFTVPAKAGLTRIEAVMRSAVDAHPGFEWWFGNVYADDGVTPLDWWK